MIAPEDPPLLTAAGVVKGYRTSAGYVSVLTGAAFDVKAGEMVGIVGASGVGKSTLLHVLGTLDRPEAGEIRVAGRDVLALSEADLRQFRNEMLGFVFQLHHLLPEFSSLENVMMPLLIARVDEASARKRAAELLDEMGLGHRADHRPAALSGGEQQRVAVARALARQPKLLMADEPSGNLDRATGDRLHDLLRRLADERGLAVVAVTHNERLAAVCDRVLRLEGGTLGPEPPAGLG